MRRNMKEIGTTKRRLRDERCGTMESTSCVDAKPDFALKVKAANLNLFCHSTESYREGSKVYANRTYTAGCTAVRSNYNTRESIAEALK